MGIAMVILGVKASPSSQTANFLAVRKSFLIVLGLSVPDSVFQLCRKTDCLVSLFELDSDFGRFIAISASATRVHSGLSLLNFRYDFSHMRSIASFLEFISSSPLPPILMGAYKVSMFMGDFVFSLHMNFLILFSSFFSAPLGIPCT